VDVTFNAADGSPAMRAGSHPFVLTTTMRLNTVESSGLESPDGDLRDLQIEYPPGFVVSPTAAPRCSIVDFLDIEGAANACSDSSAIGIGKVTASSSGALPTGTADFRDPVPVYNLTPVAGAVGRIGLVAAGQPIVAELGLSAVPPHNGFARVTDLTQTALFYSARISVWGNPADPAHDGDRGQCAFSAALCPANVPVAPFLTVPRSCTGAVETGFEATSWDDPPALFATTVLSHDGVVPPNPLGFMGCSKVEFLPQIDVQPTTDLADAPSGLDVSLDFVDGGLVDPNGIAQSELKKLVLSLPEGMIVDLETIEELAACTPPQYAQESLDAGSGGGCPPESGVGTVEVEAPLLPGEILKGQVFIAQPDDPDTAEPGAENPFDSALALYVVVSDPELGVLVKQPGEIEFDPIAEQLSATFEALPQLPLSHVGLHLPEGDEGPLLTPLDCEEFTSKAVLTPWSNPGSPVVATVFFEIVPEVEGGPCLPEEEGPFDPGIASPPPNPIQSDPTRVSPPSPRKARPCPKGKRRVRGKTRCVKRRCRPVRRANGVVKRCARSSGRRPR
jgi:hypothetical protein